MFTRVCLVAGLGAGLLAAVVYAADQPGSPAAPATRPTPAPAARPAPAPKRPVGPNRLFVWVKGQVVSMDPNGDDRRPTLAGLQSVGFSEFSISHDGTRVAAPGWRTLKLGEDSLPTSRLYVERLGRVWPDVEVEDLGDPGRTVWSADDTELVVSTPPRIGSPKEKAAHAVYRFATKARTPLELPDTHHVCDWSADGRHFLTVEAGWWNGNVFAAAWVMNRDGTPVRKLTTAKTGPLLGGRFSPDGRRVLGGTAGAVRELVVAEVATGAMVPVAGVPPRPGGRLSCGCWSPDGRRIAYVWEDEPEPGHPRGHVTICDQDGTTHRTVLTVDLDPGRAGIGAVYWR